MTYATDVAPVNAKPLPQTAHTFDVLFAPDETRVAHIRRIAAGVLQMWNLGDPLAENAVLAVSELVTNAIQHGHGNIELRMRYEAEELRVEVEDENPKPAELRPPDDDAESGRGLFLVAVISKTWGVSDGGRTTWCAFRVPAGRP